MTEERNKLQDGRRKSKIGNERKGKGRRRSVRDGGDKRKVICGGARSRKAGGR